MANETGTKPERTKSSKSSRKDGDRKGGGRKRWDRPKDGAHAAGYESDDSGASAVSEAYEKHSRHSAWMARYKADAKPEVSGKAERRGQLGWLIDSGASRHMTPQRELFIEYSKKRGTVEFGNKDELTTPGKGTIEIRLGGHL